MEPRRKQALAYLQLFLIFTLFYAVTFTFREITDTRVIGLQTRALALHGDLEVGRYGSEYLPRLSFTARNGPNVYSIYGAGPSIVALPAAIPLVRVAKTQAVTQGALAILFTAGSAVAMFALLSDHFSRHAAVAGTAVFAFGTTIWPLGAMAFYSHDPGTFLEILGLRWFLQAKPGSAWKSGLAVGLATWVRPTYGPLIAALGIWYLFHSRRALFMFGAATAPGIAALFVQNRWLWGHWLKSGYSFAGIGFGGRLGDNLLNLTFGWRRGIFIYSPVLLIGMAGIAIAFKDRGEMRGRLAALAVGFGLTMGVYAKYTVWWAGDSQFGYRFLLECVPILIVAGVYGIERAPRLRPFAALLATISIATMTAGAAPISRAFDAIAFPNRLMQTPFGLAWKHALHQPIPFAGRLSLVALTLAAIVLLTRANARRDAQIEAPA